MDVLLLFYYNNIYKQIIYVNINNIYADLVNDTPGEKTKEIRKNQKSENLWEVRVHDVNGEMCRFSARAPHKLFQAPAMGQQWTGEWVSRQRPQAEARRATHQSPSFCHRASPTHLH